MKDKNIKQIDDIREECLVFQEFPCEGNLQGCEERRK